MKCHWWYGGFDSWNQERMYEDFSLGKKRAKTETSAFYAYGEGQEDRENIPNDTEIFPFHRVLCTTVEFTKE
jgi:hypothetical protein